MNKAFSLISATALAAAMALPVAAEELPLNTVTGGQGQENVDGQAAGGLGSGASAALAATAVVAVIVVADDEDDVVATDTD